MRNKLAGGLLWILAGLAIAAEPYTAATTYKKLIKNYPFIEIASATPGEAVRHIPNLNYSGTLQLDLYLPARQGAKAAPAVVLVHGGGWASGERSNLAPMALRLAERGVAAATVSYRLSGQAQYPAAIHDVKAAVRWVRAHSAQYQIDPQRIAVAGGSAGGQIASLVGVTNGMDKFDPGAAGSSVSSAVQAIINIDGLSDFTSPAARVNEDDPAKKPSAAGAWLGGRYAEVAERWREASPTFYVNKSTPPVFYIGSAQTRFSVGREEMIEKLTAAGVASRVLLLPDSPHSFWLFDPWLQPTVDAMLDFLHASGSGAPWQADLGNGSYRNPILHADYSDPDAIRVGDTYYMTSSSFSNVPGMPLLTSQDMVNWRLVGHALPRLQPEGVFAAPQPGKGVWAPCLRYHAGKFWIFYPDPDHGVYVITAERFDGPWSAPHLLLPGRGIIDPTPLWDDDGKAYLLHAWAKSRAGINNLLTLRKMAPDGRSLLDTEGRIVIDGNKLPGYRTLEGPKFYKHEGYYYVFAPAGGVEEGWQSVFRSRSIEGPYEDRIVMAQGQTAINGPHQGAWVRAADGKDWFFHFQDKRAYGRVVHLQPMQWRDGWPLIGEAVGESTIGQPYTTHTKPVQCKAPHTPPVSDEFSSATLGPQWQWSANSLPRWHSLAARAGQLRLPAQLGGNLRKAPWVLTQKPPAPAFTVDTRIELGGGTAHQAGLVMLGMNYAWVGLRQEGGKTQLVWVTCSGTPEQCSETEEVVAVLPKPAAYLRMQVSEGVARFSYSEDDKVFKAAGKPFTMAMGRWVGAQMGVFSLGAEATAYADVDYFRVR